MKVFLIGNKKNLSINALLLNLKQFYDLKTQTVSNYEETLNHRNLQDLRDKEIVLILHTNTYFNPNNFLKYFKKSYEILKNEICEVIILGTRSKRVCKRITHDISLANCFGISGFLTLGESIKTFKPRFYGSSATFDENLCFYTKTGVINSNVIDLLPLTPTTTLTLYQVYCIYSKFLNMK